MNDNEREMDLALAEAEQENRLLRARNERLERELAENARELGLDYEPAPVQPVADQAFLERVLAAMEGVIDVADRATDEFDALRSCVVDLTVMLHTPPAAQRQWVGLTDEEIEQGCKESWVTEQAFQSAVWWAEAKLKEKNT
jgi:hypothetical protein